MAGRQTCKNTHLCSVEIESGVANNGSHKLEAIQRWSAICHVWPWTLTCQKFLLCISSRGQDLHSHKKLNMYIYSFSS